LCRCLCRKGRNLCSIFTFRPHPGLVNYCFSLLQGPQARGVRIIH
jgi:hypothetical protein